MAEQNFDVEKAIREYLPQIAHMSLATVKDSKPWVCEVHYAFDDDLHLYFCSSLSTRHSEELRNNPHVAGNMVTQHFLHQKVRGVYFEGSAEQLENVDESHPAYQAYNQRYSVGPQVVQATSAEGKARFYKITVTDFYVFDGYVTNPPEKFHLSWKGKQ
jgi:uncharacterized protein YhbP (UPF0306 family)